ncbi:MAG: hypothetical protein AAF984_06340 [Verrucomicrobiota bacterium]
MFQNQYLTWDAINRLLDVTYMDAQGNAINSSRAYTYDKVGHLLSVSEPGKGTDANVSYVYDALNRITEETSGGVTHGYRYDLAGNHLEMVYGGTGLNCINTYDALNYLKDRIMIGHSFAHTQHLTISPFTAAKLISEKSSQFLIVCLRGRKERFAKPSYLKRVLRV